MASQAHCSMPTSEGTADMDSKTVSNDVSSSRHLHQFSCVSIPSGVAMGLRMRIQSTRLRLVIEQWEVNHPDCQFPLGLLCLDLPFPFVANDP